MDRPGALPSAMWLSHGSHAPRLLHTSSAPQRCRTAGRLLVCAPNKAPRAHRAARRQLDCAGVVTTVLAACQRLARSPAHEDLLGVRFQARAFMPTLNLPYSRRALPGARPRPQPALCAWAGAGPASLPRAPPALHAAAYSGGDRPCRQGRPALAPTGNVKAVAMRLSPGARCSSAH